MKHRRTKSKQLEIRENFSASIKESLLAISLLFSLSNRMKHKIVIIIKNYRAKSKFLFLFCFAESSDQNRLYLMIFLMVPSKIYGMSRPAVLDRK